LARRGLAQTNRRSALLFLLPGVLFFAAIFVYPAVKTVQMAFSRVDVTNFVSGDWPLAGFANFASLTHLQAASQTIRNTVVFLVGSIVPQLVIGGLLAVALQRPTRLRRVGRALVLLPWLLPSVAVSAIFLWIFNTRSGLANWVLESLHAVPKPVQWFTGSNSALFVIILVNIWIGIPFNFLILQSGLQAVTDDVHEAAIIDGAGWWRELWSITLPIMKESVFAVVMLGLIGTLKVFDFVWIMTQGGPANATMLPGPLAYQQAFQQFNYGRGSAIVVIVVAVMLALSLVYVRVTTPRTPRLRRRAASPLPAAGPRAPAVVRPRTDPETGGTHS
jgi:multiple sugar transport system permease protein